MAPKVHHSCHTSQHWYFVSLMDLCKDIICWITKHMMTIGHHLLSLSLVKRFYKKLFTKKSNATKFLNVYFLGISMFCIGMAINIHSGKAKIKSSNMSLNVKSTFILNRPTIDKLAETGRNCIQNPCGWLVWLRNWSQFFWRNRRVDGLRSRVLQLYCEYLCSLHRCLSRHESLAPSQLLPD